MNGGDRVVRRRKSLTERLGLKVIGCCGSTWGILPTTTFNVVDDENDDTEVVEGSSGMNLAAALAAERHFRADNSEDNESINIHSGSRPDPNSNLDCHYVNNIHSVSRPNSNSSLGPLRLDDDVGGPGNVPETPTRMSLMRLLEETELYEGELLIEKEEGEMGNDSMCCVCMRRKKGAAFIPCGHTFCRVCSRELWVNRGCCPLCNKSILEILDIY